MASIRLLLLFTGLSLLIPMSVYADEDPILASPLFELPAEALGAKEAGKRPRDDESLNCSERFEKGDEPSCLDESENPIIEYPLANTCGRGTELKLMEAGDCENPCRCQDLDGESDRKSVVSCYHPRTRWSCAPPESAERSH